MSVCLYISMVSTKNQTAAADNCALSYFFIASFDSLCSASMFHVYPSSVNKLLDQFLMQTRDVSKESCLIQQ